MVEVGLQEVETSVYRCQNTVAQYIVTRTNMDLCMTSKRRPGTRMEMRLWEQESLDLEGIHMLAWEAKQTRGGEGDEWDRDCE